MSAQTEILKILCNDQPFRRRLILGAHVTL